MEKNSNGKTKSTASMKDLINEAKPDSVAITENGQEIDVIEVEDFKLVDAQVTAEIVDAMRGVFTHDVVYNMPKRSSSGRTEWAACDRMPNGYCKYRGKDKHVHILGIGIHGALVAMNVYGGLEVSCPDMPTIVEMADKLYWVVRVTCEDTIRRNRLERWQFEPVMKQASGSGFYEDPFAHTSVQSRGIRNLILACIPQSIQAQWISDYLAGKDSFDPQRVLEYADNRALKAPQLPPAKPKPPTPPPAKAKPEAPAKERPPTEGEQNLDSVSAAFAKKLKVDWADVSLWTTTFETPGKAMLALVGAMNDDAKFKELSLQFEAWRKKGEPKTDENGQTEMEV